jgi:hypothetical protein
MSPKEYLQKVRHIADYYVCNGNEIRIQPHPAADEKSVRLFMLSNAMAAILHQRNSIPLHASGIFYQDGVALFCGPSGMGKSTLVTALEKKGYKIFSDDVCVLKTVVNNDQTVMAVPSYPMMKLWLDSFAKTGLELPDDEAKLRPNLAKFGRFYHEDYQTAAMPIRRVFLLNTHNLHQQPGIQKMGSIESFNALQRNTYRHVQMDGMKKRSHHFAIVSRLAASVSVYRINRPQHLNTIDELSALIEANLHNE